MAGGKTKPEVDLYSLVRGFWVIAPRWHFGRESPTLVIHSKMKDVAPIFKITKRKKLPYGSETRLS